MGVYGEDMGEGMRALWRVENIWVMRLGVGTRSECVVQKRAENLQEIKRYEMFIYFIFL